MHSGFSLQRAGVEKRRRTRGRAVNFVVFDMVHGKVLFWADRLTPISRSSGVIKPLENGADLESEHSAAETTQTFSADRSHSVLY